MKKILKLSNFIHTVYGGGGDRLRDSHPLNKKVREKRFISSPMLGGEK